jgi:hypothetical protein
MNRDLKIAILEKISDILDNIDCPQTCLINFAYYGDDEAPSINYNVKELIVSHKIEE